MSRTRTSGFSLVEMAITILVLGMLFAFSIPAFQGITASNNLKGATENLAAQLRLSREKAMSIQMEQPMHLNPNGLNTDYHIHYPSGFIPATSRWTLPRGITFYSYSDNWATMLKDGRIDGSGMVILRDERGNRDTVSYLSSGLVLTK